MHDRLLGGTLHLDPHVEGVCLLPERVAEPSRYRAAERPADVRHLCFRGPLAIAAVGESSRALQVDPHCAADRAGGGVAPLPPATDVP
eukprot:903135-Heterocapsa_arctica.AAC.1